MGEIKGYGYNKVTPIESIYDIIRIARDEAPESIAVKHKINKPPALLRGLNFTLISSLGN